MSLKTLLAKHPTATVVDRGEDGVVDGLLGDTETEVATGVPVWASDRRPASVVYDEAGSVVVDADVICAQRALDHGQRLDLTDGRSYIVAGAGRHAVDRHGLSHRTYPARRIDAAGS